MSGYDSHDIYTDNSEDFSSDEEQDNPEAEYQKILKQLVDLRTKKYRKKILSDEDKKNIKDLFEQTTNKVANENVNQQEDTYTLLELAAYFGKDKIINDLLENYLEKLTTKPKQLGHTIYWAAAYGHDNALGALLNNPTVLKTVIENFPKRLDNAIFSAAGSGHDKALEKLLTKDILGKLQKKSPITLQEIEKHLNYFKENDLTKEVKTVVSEGLKNIKELRNRKTVKTALVAGGVVAGGAAAVVGGTFVGALLAEKGLNLAKDTRLVTNHLLPAFNKVNDQLMKISSKLDLNKLAKAFTDPKIAGLMIGMAAILGVISSIVAGVGAHKKQGGTILGR